MLVESSFDVIVWRSILRCVALRVVLQWMSFVLASQMVLMNLIIGPRIRDTRTALQYSGPIR